MLSGSLALLQCSSSVCTQDAQDLRGSAYDRATKSRMIRYQRTPYVVVSPTPTLSAGVATASVTAVPAPETACQYVWLMVASRCFSLSYLQ